MPTPGSGGRSTGCMSCSRHGAVSARVCSSSHMTPALAGICPSVRAAHMLSGWPVPLGEHDALLKPACVGCLGAHARTVEAAAPLWLCDLHPYAPAPTGGRCVLAPVLAPAGSTEGGGEGVEGLPRASRWRRDPAQLCGACMPPGRAQMEQSADVIVEGGSEVSECCPLVGDRAAMKSKACIPSFVLLQNKALGFTGVLLATDQLVTTSATEAGSGSARLLQHRAMPTGCRARRPTTSNRSAAPRVAMTYMAMASHLY